MESFTPHSNKKKGVNLRNIFQSQPLSKSARNKSEPSYIPYTHERDSIGRLLSKNQGLNPEQSNFRCKTQPRKSAQVHNLIAPVKSRQQQKVNNTIVTFFKKMGIEEKQTLRLNNKKQSFMIPNKLPRMLIKSKQTIEKVTLLKKQEKKVTYQSIKVKTKISPSQQKKKKKKKKKILTERDEKREKKSSPIRKKKQKQSNSSFNSDKSLSRQISLTEMMQFPQLKRSVLWKKLSVKVFPDFLEGHERFKKEMEHAKYIAQQVRISLQNI